MCQGADTVVRNTSAGVSLTVFETWLCHLQAVWSWISYLTSLCFSFLFYKKEGIIEVTLYIPYEDQVNLGKAFQVVLALLLF